MLAWEDRLERAATAELKRFPPATSPDDVVCRFNTIHSQYPRQFWKLSGDVKESIIAVGVKHAALQPMPTGMG
jgi:hypothetical protein